MENISLQEGVSIRDFVEHVWGFDPTRLEWGAWIFEPKVSQQRKFLLCGKDFGRSKPFCDMLKDASGKESEQIPNVIMLNEGARVPARGDRKLRFPDAAVCMEFQVEYDTPTVRGVEQDGSQEGTRRGLHVDLQTPKAKQLSEDELPLARYALESLSDVGNRRFVTGVLVQDKSLSLWYFDRTGFIKSEDLPIFEEPELFVLVSVALFRCDPRHLGYEPLIQPRPPNSSALPPSRIPRSNFRITPWSMAKRRMRSIKFGVSGPALYVQYGMTGCGTVVLLIKTLHECHLVATHLKEDELIRDLRKTVQPRWQGHLPDLKFSLTIDEADAQLAFLPQTHLTGMYGVSPPEPRVLRILATPRYHYLRDARSLDEFKSVFLDIIHTHRAVYLQANILHWDLSVGNLIRSIVGTTHCRTSPYRADRKELFLSKGKTYPIIMDAITPAFKPLYVQWILPLHDIFNDYVLSLATRRLAISRRKAVMEWDEETAGGTVTYERFMEALGASPKLDS
ncbi:hypothetical protein EVG20_g7422 [Dentipellis fragilis]|uniref:Fungal-type protein kinase domain-containing protein n=1 Tax=Dentipellis fragilis TaxID=205917 RepID=A0A4Y9YFD8_9AGAM|nr:hypothetical protein EVG20_g7422 [Dentipellis fragilis]